MSFVSTGVECLPFIWQAVVEHGPIVGRTLVTQVAEKKLAVVVGSCMAGPTVTALIISAPFVVDKVKDIAIIMMAGNRSSCHLNSSVFADLTKDFCNNRMELFGLFLSAVLGSATVCPSFHLGNMARAFGLDFLREQLKPVVGLSVSNVAYAVTANKIFPSASPLTLPAARCCYWVVSCIAKKAFPRLLQSPSKEDFDESKIKEKEEVEAGFVFIEVVSAVKLTPQPDTDTDTDTDDWCVLKTKRVRNRQLPQLSSCEAQSSKGKPCVSEQKRFITS